jgi:hypothetical protein
MIEIPPALETLMIVAGLLLPTSLRKLCVMSNVPLTFTSCWELAPPLRLLQDKCSITIGKHWKDRPRTYYARSRTRSLLDPHL